MSDIKTEIGTVINQLIEDYNYNKFDYELNTKSIGTDSKFYNKGKHGYSAKNDYPLLCIVNSEKNNPFESYTIEIFCYRNNYVVDYAKYADFERTSLDCLETINVDEVMNFILKNLS